MHDGCGWRSVPTESGFRFALLSFSSASARSHARASSITVQRSEAEHLHPVTGCVPLRPILHRLEPCVSPLPTVPLHSLLAPAPTAQHNSVSASLVLSTEDAAEQTVSTSRQTRRPSVTLSTSRSASVSGFAVRIER